LIRQTLCRSFGFAGEVAIDRFHDSGLLFLGEAGEDRQIQHFLACFFSLRQRAGIDVQVVEALLQVHRHGVIDFAADTALGHEGAKRIPLPSGDANGVLVPHVESIGISRWQHDVITDQIRFAQHSGVASGDVGSVFNRLGQGTQLHSQHSRLERIQSTVDADDLVVIPRSHAMSGQQSQTVGGRRIGGRHHSAIAHATEILGWVKAEASHQSPASSRSRMIGRADRLSCIFDDRDVVVASDLANPIDLGALSEQMNRDDCLGVGSDRGFNQVGIDVERVGSDVDEHGRRAQPRDAADRGKESETRHDHFIAWANRGLLRRARKLLSDTQALNPEPSFEQAPLSVRVAHGDQQHTVTLAEAGFKHLDCSCDALGPCQHAICALLFVQDWLQQHPATITESSDGDHQNDAIDPPAPATLAPGPWLIDSHVERIKQLGRKELESATEKLKRGLPVSIQEERNALVGTVIEQQSYRVRIPRNAGLDASLCECGKARCLHRAAVVLKALDEAGFCALEQLPEAPLNSEEQHSLNDSRDWLHHIVRVGLHQLEPHSISRGQALATQVRQSGFPRLAGQLSRLCEVLKQELKAQAAVSTQAIRERILDTMILIRALQTEPMPRPRYQLAGVHRREYFQCAKLELHCVGLQAWVSSRGMSGLSLHFCDRLQQQWYRYNVVRPQQQYGRFSPQELISSERWAATTGGTTTARTRVFINRDGALIVMTFVGCE